MTDWWWGSAILQVEVGSTAHGTGLPDVEDFDNLAIVLEPPSYRLGLDQAETIVHRPGRGPHDRSGPGDWDLTVYTLHKWLRLALKGNPSILSALWAPVITSTNVGRELRHRADCFVGRHLVAPYLGYANAQRERLMGLRGGTHVKRPELVEQHGYDTKYAMHMLRLGFQGIELLTTGQIAYPATERDFLYSVRRGAQPLDQVVQVAMDNEARLRSLRDEASIPPGPLRDRMQAWLIVTYQSFYAQMGRLNNTSTTGVIHPRMALPGAGRTVQVVAVERATEVPGPHLGGHFGVLGMTPDEGDGASGGGGGHRRVEAEIQNEPHVEFGGGHRVHATHSTRHQAQFQEIVKSPEGDS